MYMYVYGYFEFSNDCPVSVICEGFRGINQSSPFFFCKRQSAIRILKQTFSVATVFLYIVYIEKVSHYYSCMFLKYSVEKVYK